MNCLIGLSLTLIAIVAGMLLLAKTQKDNLGAIYKVISYFVIITAFLAFLCGVGCGICRSLHCMKDGCPQKMEQCGMMSGCSDEGGSCCKMMGGRGMMGCGKMGKKKCKKMCKKGDTMWEEEDDDDDDEQEDIKVEIMQKQVEKEKQEPAKK